MTNPNHFADTLFLTPYKNKTKIAMTNPYPPKTARWWFAEYLPEPYRGQAIANYDEKYLIDTNPDGLTVENLADAIDFSFDWRTTPKDQGIGHWESVWQRARDGEFSTPNAPSPTSSAYMCDTCVNKILHVGSGAPDDYGTEYCSKGHWEGLLYEDEREACGHWKGCQDYTSTPSPTAEQIQSATASFAGVETDTHMNEVRGRDNMNTYTIQTTQFSATVIAADQQGAMDILFKYMLNCAAFTFRFDRGNIVAGSSDVPEWAKAGILEYEKR